MEITPEMIKLMMDEMDKQLLKGDTNVWQDACEIARYNIAYKILKSALKN